MMLNMLCPLVLLFALSVTCARVPTIKIQQSRSAALDMAPSFEIVFPNGQRDFLELDIFYPSEESRQLRKSGCNYFGHLKYETSACVAVTGCLGQDDLEFTINSKNRYFIGSRAFSDTKTHISVVQATSTYYTRVVIILK